MMDLARRAVEALEQIAVELSKMTALLLRRAATERSEGPCCPANAQDSRRHDLETCWRFHA